MLSSGQPSAYPRSGHPLVSGLPGGPDGLGDREGGDHPPATRDGVPPTGQIRRGPASLRSESSAQRPPPLPPTVAICGRDRLIVDESAHLAAQLPTLIRGIYFEGWDPSGVPVKMDDEEFLARIRQEFPYDVRGGVQQVIETVLRALRRHITEGEWEGVKTSMPKELASILP
jgi:uncharacterized protein (DUF2267 family)